MSSKKEDGEEGGDQDSDRIEQRRSTSRVLRASKLIEPLKYTEVLGDCLKSYGRDERSEDKHRYQTYLEYLTNRPTGPETIDKPPPERGAK